MKRTVNEERIILMVLPFWTPLIPPLGISCLKSHVARYGYDVKTIDANTEPVLWDTYWDYFGLMKKIIPDSKKGNFYNTGHDVLINHLMAHLHHQDTEKHEQLLAEIVYKNYYVTITKDEIRRLDDLVEIFYGNLRNYILRMIEDEQPTVVGISAYSGTLAPSMFAFQLIKELDPGITTIMGGGIFADQLKPDTPNYHNFLNKTPYIDKIVVGEGEIVFQKLLEGSLSETQRVFTLQDIADNSSDLSQFQAPDFSDFNMEVYPYLANYASRSCPFQCSFCSETVQWGKYRKKSTSQIVEELKTLYQQHKYQLFLFGDSLLNPFITDMSNEIIKSGLSLYWDGYLRADKHTTDLNNTFLWRKGGFYRARLGVESGSDRILKLMDKKITSEDIKAAITSLAVAGVKTTTYFVIGYPGETEEDFLQTLNLVAELKNDIYEAECNPFKYFLNGQVAAKQWQEEKSSLLYQEDKENTLITQTWILDTEPSREAIYERICRFARHCRKLGIPNPYSKNEIYEADMRWKKLHRNAVPSIIEFNHGAYITENYQIEKPLAVKTNISDETDFGF